MLPELLLWLSLVNWPSALLGSEADYPTGASIFHVDEPKAIPEVWPVRFVPWAQIIHGHGMTGQRIDVSNNPDWTIRWEDDLSVRPWWDLAEEKKLYGAISPTDLGQRFEDRVLQAQGFYFLMWRDDFRLHSDMCQGFESARQSNSFSIFGMRRALAARWNPPLQYDTKQTGYWSLRIATEFLEPYEFPVLRTFVAKPEEVRKLNSDWGIFD